MDTIQCANRYFPEALYVCLSKLQEIFDPFCLRLCCGSVFLWWLCDKLCTSGFVDDVTLAHYRRLLARHRRRAWSVFKLKVVYRRATPGTKFDVCDYLCVFWWHTLVGKLYHLRFFAVVHSAIIIFLKLSSIEDRGLTDRVTTLPRPHALDSAARLATLERNWYHHSKNVLVYYGC